MHDVEGKIQENFYSHAPCGARPAPAPVTLDGLTFLLTRPLRGATAKQSHGQIRAHISTHTPLAGRDPHDSHPGQF